MNSTAAPDTDADDAEEDVEGEDVDAFSDAAIGAGPTRVSLILAVVQGGEEAERALAELVKIYREPLLAYVLRKGVGVADAEDAVQSFVLKMLIGQVLLAKAAEAAERGERKSFRGLLRRAMDGWLVEGARRENAQKRGGGGVKVSLEAMLERCEAVAGRETGPDEAFDLLWADGILDRAMLALEKKARAAGKGLRLAVLGWLRAGGPEHRRPALVAALGGTENDFSQELSRLRSRYLPRAMRAELWLMCRGVRMFQEEWLYLCQLCGMKPDAAE